MGSHQCQAALFQYCLLFICFTCCVNLTSGHAEGRGRPGDADPGRGHDPVEDQELQGDVDQGQGHGKGQSFFFKREFMSGVWK